jgi:hypothetical protein
VKIKENSKWETFGAASAELNLFKFCRVVTKENEVKWLNCKLEDE